MSSFFTEAERAEAIRSHCDALAHDVPHEVLAPIYEYADEIERAAASPPEGNSDG